MSIILTAVPNPPAEYVFRAEANRLSLAEMREVVAQADAANVPGNFRLVNSGHGRYSLRKPA